MRLIDLLNEIVIDNLYPSQILYDGKKWISDYYTDGIDYKEEKSGKLLFANIGTSQLNDTYEMVEDKDIPLIPDDELIILKQSKTVDMQNAIDFNFRVVEEKINQIIEELNKKD